METEYGQPARAGAPTQISGLVITLEPDASPGSLQTALRARPEFVVGEARDRWLAVAAEAPDAAGSLALHDWLRALPEVAHVDVVHVSFEAGGGPEEGRVDVPAIGGSSEGEGLEQDLIPAN